MSNRNLFFVILILVGALGPIFQGKVGGKAPFKTDKLSVLILEETTQRPSYTQDQLFAITGNGPGSVDEAVKLRGGEFYPLDVNNTDLKLMPQWVQDAAKVPHEPDIPWIVTAGPKYGVSEPLPKSRVDILKAVEAAK